MSDDALLWVGGGGGGAAIPPPAGDDRLRTIREGRLRILVIDDEEDYRLAVVDDLKRRYWAIVQDAVSGEEGLRQAPAQPYHVVIVDFGLDGIDGIAVCQHLIKRGDPSTLILASARQDRKVKAVAEEMGVTYLDKPMDDELLCSILLSVAMGQTNE